MTNGMVVEINFKERERERERAFLIDKMFDICASLGKLITFVIITNGQNNTGCPLPYCARRRTRTLKVHSSKKKKTKTKK
jgi:hypothetical protein